MATIYPTSGLHSSSDNEYGRLASQRVNVSIITRATVFLVLFASSLSRISANGAEFLYDGEIMNIQATKEVILTVVDMR